MPKQVPPGVYIEESERASKAVPDVDMGIAGFAGMTRNGPFAAEQAPALLRSFFDFESVYGGADGADGEIPARGYLTRAVRAFFDEGGSRLYVARVAGDSPGLEEWIAALAALAKLDGISTVAAPGSTELGVVADAVQSALVAHAEANGRFAVLDVPAGKSPAEAMEYRRRFNSRSAALYYPWIVPDPQGPVQPPSGFVCGIYARNDRDAGVFKAPANVLIHTAGGFEKKLTQQENGSLNGDSINCLREINGRGRRVWGARTLSEEPEWRYVNVRRYWLFLDRSIGAALKPAVFEQNDERLWAGMAGLVSGFLHEEWRRGAILGATPRDAYFIRCDRSTMSRTDLDQGKMICLVGVALLKPGEFTILRVGVQTADGIPR
jgi:phage tail sheath protein FI